MKKQNKYSSSLKKSYKDSKTSFKNIQWTRYVVFQTIYQTLARVMFFFAIISVLLFGLIFGVGTGYFLGLVKDEPVKSEAVMKKSLYEMTQSTTVNFASGDSLGTLKSDIQRTIISYEDMSPHIVDALIATEDENFYKHKGIVPKAFIRASAQEILGSESSSGGSTITQQLVKNQLLSNETSFERKAKEMLLSFRVEKTLSKKDIMEAYLNVVSFGRNTNGQNVAGVEAASIGLFGKHAKDLNISQSAFIAGLPQNPYAYTPFLTSGQLKDDNAIEYGLNRQQYVLSRMLHEKKITQKEYDEAKAYNLKNSFVKEIATPQQKYPFLVEEVERRAVDILKIHFAKEDKISKEDLLETPVLNEKYTTIANDALRNKGYVVNTTIDKKIYDQMQDIKNNPAYYSYDRAGIIDGKEQQMQQEVGVILKENKTGKIISFVGGRDYNKSQNNHATLTKRSPGSTMKPLLAYGPAIDMGDITPETMLLDKRFNINGYDPENYARKEYGQVTTRYALQNSFNLSLLRMYSSIQHKKPWEYLEKMHISIPDSEKENLSLPLGSTDITLLNDVDGFSTFANKGNYQESYMIESIKTTDGTEIYKHTAKPERVFNEETAYIMTDMLRGVLTYEGSAYELVGQLYYGQDWVGKTGTSQDAKDSLFIAYNPKVTMGIWMGYDQPTTFDEENHYQLKMWRDLNNTLSESHGEQMGIGAKFDKPSGVQDVAICQFTQSTSGKCAPGEKVKNSLVFKKSDLSQKSMDDPRVLNRLGQLLDPNTKNKINEKEKPSKDKKKDSTTPSNKDKQN